MSNTINTQALSIPTRIQFSGQGKEYDALNDALRHGDMNAAKNAYADLQKRMDMFPRNHPEAPKLSEDAKKAFADLGTAIQSGDMTKVRAEFRTYSITSQRRQSLNGSGGTMSNSSGHAHAVSSTGVNLRA